MNYLKPENAITKLKKGGLDCELITVAKTGSYYIKFSMQEMGKLRVGDHNEREKYGYRWQLRLDQKEPFQEKEVKGHKQYFYAVWNMAAMIKHMKNYKRAIMKRLEKAVN